MRTEKKSANLSGQLKILLGEITDNIMSEKTVLSLSEIKELAQAIAITESLESKKAPKKDSSKKAASNAEEDESGIIILPPVKMKEDK